MRRVKPIKIVYLNGKFIPDKDARILINHSGALNGLGVFETMRFFKGSTVYLSQHLKRLKYGCRKLNIKFYPNEGALKNIITRTIAKNALADARVRITLWKNNSGSDILITAAKYQPYTLSKYNRGFSLSISKIRQESGSFLAKLKTTSRAFYETAFLKAKENGYDDALILNNRGFICEATRSNIFFIKDGMLFTPELQCGCLDGITRKAVFDLASESKISHCAGKFTLKDIYASDEAFLTNSLMGIMPLTKINNTKIRAKKNGLTAFFIKKYKDLLYGN